MRYFWLLVYFAASSASALSVDLHQVPVNDLVRVVFNDLLKTSYVVDAPIVADQSPVSVTLRDVESSVVYTQVVSLLVSRGYAVEKKGGVVSIRKRSDSFADDEIFVYRPLYRSAQYLTDLASALFRTGAFLGNRPQSQLNFSAVSGGLPNTAPVQGVNQMLQTDADIIVFRGTTAEIVKLQSLYNQIDVASGELLISAVVFEVSKQHHKGSAVDLIFSLLKSRFGLSLKIDTGAASSSGSASASFSGSGVDFLAVFDVLTTDDRFRVLTSPRLRVRSGASARFSVGNETPVLSSVSYDSAGRPISSVQYKPAGVILELKPVVRGAVSDCTVTQQLSQFVATSNGVNNSPTLIKRELSTDVSLTDGQIVLLGGLDEDKTTANVSGLPFLPEFLSSSRSDYSHTEIVVMLSAYRVDK